MKLSVVIPARNEAANLAVTIPALVDALQGESIEHEILVVDDGSSDGTRGVILGLSEKFDQVRMVSNPAPHGFGLAVRRGLKHFTGDAVAVFMADASDHPKDLIHFWRVICQTNADCVFGTRFHSTSRVTDYPVHKLVLNRMGNKIIQLVFGLRYNDCTNAFKMYRRHVIEGLTPFLSHHFNLTVELPLKAIVRGFSYEIVPNDWTNRSHGVSKFRVKEMGSRYLFIILYCLIEKWLSRGDYRYRPSQPVKELAPTLVGGPATSEA